ncbi:MAG TPA: Gldg family protein [Xanthobacteraceae bacterium]|nr:Gldg family protein [Xanthobacteraceae bacterium]
MSNQTQPETRKPLPTGRIALIAALLGAVVFVCVNIVSAQVFRNTRVDLTQQHLYSLSQGTRTLLDELNEPVRFRLFMSSGLTKQAPQLAAFAGRVRSLLDSYVAAAKGSIVLEVIDPRPFSEEEDRAVAFGIDGFTGTGGERLFFGLAATNSTTGQATIRAFAPDREAFLEYDLTRLVSELGRRGKPVVALLDGLGLAGNPSIGLPEQQVLTQMKQFFEVKPLSGEVEKLPDDTRVLMVVHPKNLSEKTLYTIDQWVMAGNATMIFVDPYAENQFSPRGAPEPGEPPPAASSNLEPLFKAWGVKFDTERAVGDPDYALQTQRDVGGRPVTAPNLTWMALRGDALARDEAILAQLSAIVMTTAGAFETTKDGVTLRPLVRASNAAVTVNALIAGDRRQDPRRVMSEAKKAPKPPIVAARLTGMLDSAYPDGLKTDEKKPDEAKAAAEADESKKDEGKAADNTLKKSAKPASVILVGDADMLMDRNWVQMQSLFGQQVAQSFANNGDFVVNAIEQMSGGAALSDLRGRGVSWRPFELIQRMEAEADSRFRKKERALSVQLEQTQQKLSQLPKAAEGSNQVVTAEQAKTIEGFRAQLLVIRSELRDVQFALRRDVDNLKNLVTALNVGVVPVTIGFIALAFGMRRPRRPLPKKPSNSAA